MAVALLATAGGLGVWLLTDRGAKPPVPAEVAAAPVEPVPVRPAEVLLARLRANEPVRLRTGDVEMEVSKHSAELGTFEPAERAEIVDVLRQRTAAFERGLEAAHARENWTSAEKRDYEQGKALAQLIRHQAYERAFAVGDYLVLPLDEKAPDLGDDIVALHMGGTCGGTRVQVLVLVDKAASQVGESEKGVARLRRVWLDYRCSVFNARPDLERETMLERLRAGRADDRRWREKHFPRGTSVSEDTMTIRTDA